MGALPALDSVAFFDALAAEMNANPAAYEVLGDIDLDLGIVVRRPDGDPFRVRLAFHGIACEGVAEMAPGDERTADCWLEGDLAAWQAMLEDILANGRATGRQTINSLTLLGDHIAVHGGDPMGVDRFFRFNQTVQSYFDGAAAVAASATTT